MATGPAAAHSTKTKQAVVGGLIIVAAVATLFWWGFYFQVFGSDIDWIEHPTQLGFPALVVVGAFGAGYQIGGRSGGLKAMGWALGIMLTAMALGIARKAT